MNIFNEKKDYFWEYQYPFYEDFLVKIFNTICIRKYSLGGEGICNIILLDNKIYEVSLKQCTALLQNDGKKAFRDGTKDTIINAIASRLKELNLEYTINSGKFITFKISNYICKLEVIKKAAMPI